MDIRLDRRDNRGEQGGFTIIEVLIALLILLVGMAGVLSLQLTAMQATAFSRHATEASVLAEDKIEFLRTVPLVDLVDDSDVVDARGVPDVSGAYSRDWTINVGAETTSITVSITWNEQGTDPYTITMSSLRTNN